MFGKVTQVSYCEILEVGSMKNLLLLLVVNVAFGQLEMCGDSKIFNTLFDELHLLDRENYFEVNLDYSPSSFTIESIKDFTELKKTEKTRIISFLEKGNIIICDEVLQTIKELGKKKKNKEDGTYMSFSFSKPILVSKKKKCVFLSASVRNKNHEGGKAIGNEMLYLFEKQKNGKWILTVKKVIAEY